MSLRIVVIATLSFVLAACGGGGGGSGDGNPQAPEPEQPTRASNSSCIAPEYANLDVSGLEIAPAFPLLPAIDRLVNLTQANGENDYWIAISQNGQVYRFDNTADADALDLFLDLSPFTFSTANESGLLGFALHPAYSTNGWAFIYYMPERGTARLSRFTRNTAGIALDIDSEKIILEVAQPAANHNGGGLGFGPDAYLYLSLGDGGAANDHFGNGQDTNTLLGTVLRLDINVADDAVAYAIPPDNPFADGLGGLPEIFAYGLRNPWRWSFDSLTGDFWLGDVGQNAIEEINLISAGANLGWPIKEGNSCVLEAQCNTSGLTDPVLDYRQDLTKGCSVTGGYVYRGQQLNSLTGTYVFADFCNGSIYGLNAAQRSSERQDLLATPLSITSFAQDSSGELYVLNRNGGPGGGIYKLQSSLPSNEASAIPQRLSESGCFADTAARTPAQGVVPYSVISSLWSDGASKDRLFAIPDSTTIEINDMGEFQFPQLSVLIKHFFYNEEIVETRLFMRHLNGWAGYSYAWNDQKTDALLLEGGMKTPIDENYSHLFPGRTQCLQCHLPAAGFSLGLETLQLNHTMDSGPGPHENYLDSLELAGYLASPLAEKHKQQRLYSLEGDDASTEDIARSYLHSNCAGCHRPGGPITGLDLRYQSDLADTGLCNVEPQYGNLGVAGAQLLAPGDASRSIITLRMRARNNDRMPPLASDRVDTAAVSAIEDWIGSLSGCE